MAIIFFNISLIFHVFWVLATPEKWWKMLRDGESDGKCLEINKSDGNA